MSFLDLSYGAEKIGLHTLVVRASYEDLKKTVPMPCIIHWQNDHFVVVYKIRKDRVLVSDPGVGKISYSREDFIAGWYKTGENVGVLMAVEPMADFNQRDVEERLERKKTFENFLSYFSPYRTTFRTIFLIMLITTVLQSLLPFISKAVIDVGIGSGDISFINLVLIANITIIVSVAIAGAIRDWLLLHITARVNISLISDYLIKLFNLPVTFFENKLIGDILQRAQDHERIRSFIMNNSISLAFSILTFIAFSIILLLFHPVIFSIFIVLSIIYVVWVLAFMKLRKKLDWEYFRLISRNQSYWVETVTTIQDIKSANCEKQRRWKWENIQSRLYQVNLRVLNISNAQNIGAQFFQSVKNLAVTFYCAKAVINGQITFGVMIATQFIIGMLNAPLSQFVGFIISAQYARISFLRINEIHQLEEEVDDSVSNSIEIPSSRSITVRNLSFRYSMNSPFIIKQVSFTIPEGKVTAIVGSSGSGKSTLLKLLLRMYIPTQGEILMGEMNIQNLGLRQWRDYCGVVLQDGRLLNDTILNNIVMYDEEADLAKLKESVTIAHISSEIEQMPKGYNTKVGEEGRGLSGGQKQRILIARALYRNPRLLVLDEATNSLDSINEQRIVEALGEAFKGRTVVVVAHRFSTIVNADQIIVMRNGYVVETGTHQELVHNRRHYYELVCNQLNTSPETYNLLPGALLKEASG